MKRTDTIKLSGKNYAPVAQRIKEFRADHPNSKILTRHTELETGETVFKAYIWRDRKTYVSGDLDSADSDGMAKSKPTDGDKEKWFEKLQTIAIGRALAILGYLADGEIASFEEMEEFEKFKQVQHEEYVADQLELIEKCKSLDDLKLFWEQTDKTNVVILNAKDAKKVELLNGN